MGVDNDNNLFKLPDNKERHILSDMFESIDYIVDFTLELNALECLKSSYLTFHSYSDTSLFNKSASKLQITGKIMKSIVHSKLYNLH